MSLDVNLQVLWALAGVYVILMLASIIVFVLKKSQPDTNFAELTQRTNSWWVMAAIFTLALVMNRVVSIVFFGLISYLALKEYFSIVPTRRADRRVLFWAYLVIPVQYLWVGQEWYGMFIIFIPVYVFLFLPMRMITIGETTSFLRAVGTLHWGIMTLVFSISHLAYLLVLPATPQSSAGGPGLLLYLVFLTQFNDVAQYIWGKMIGRRKVVPTVSPNKTVEGLLGGIATTTVLAVVLAPLLTPLSIAVSISAGLIISLAGFIGDCTISALKRDIGIKDSGTLIAGHGGIMDRVDSLTYSAPLFFHLMYYLYY